MRELNDPVVSENILRNLKQEGMTPERMQEVYFNLWEELTAGAHRILDAREKLDRLIESDMPVHLIAEAHVRELMKQDWGNLTASVAGLDRTIQRRHIVDAIEQAVVNLGMDKVDATTATAEQAKIVSIEVSRLLKERGVRIDTSTMLSMLELLS